MSDPRDECISLFESYFNSLMNHISMFPLRRLGVHPLDRQIHGANRRMSSAPSGLPRPVPSHLDSCLKLLWFRVRERVTNGAWRRALRKSKVHAYTGMWEAAAGGTLRARRLNSQWQASADSEISSIVSRSLDWLARGCSCQKFYTVVLVAAANDLVHCSATRGYNQTSVFPIAR